MTKQSRPTYINRGYGKEKDCARCKEFYPCTDDFFYRKSPSQQRGLTVAYEALCIPCYAERKAGYKMKAKERKAYETPHAHTYGELP